MYLCAMRMVAKTFFGFENVLKEELEELGAKDIEIANRVVQFTGDKRLMYESNLWLRTAISILIPVYSFRFKNQEDFKRQLNRIEYKKYMHVSNTFAVKGAVFSKTFSHSQFPYLLLKDAIVDYFRERHNRRPSVDKDSPDIMFDLHISDNECTISLNSSGSPLFHRGYRKKVGVAPLNEAVAAGLIKLSGWDAKSDLVDITCGAGTIPIEAALIAHGIPPNILRKHYSFQQWQDFDQQMWQDILKKAPTVPRHDLNIRIEGFDQDPEMIKIAKMNAKDLPIAEQISFKVMDLRDQAVRKRKGTLISNPPYGRRIDDNRTDELYKAIGDCLKNKMKGYDCWIISSNIGALKNIELRPDTKLRLYNGALDCEYRKYRIFDGSLKDHKDKEARQKN